METKLHKWKKQFVYIDKLMYLIVILLLGILRIDFLMIAVYFMLYPYLLLTQRWKAIKHLYVASGVAIVWIIIAKNHYGYNREVITIFGLNSFPLFAWACGLFGAYLIYSHWEHKLKNENWINKMILFCVIYWPILILLETAAYHLFFIRNLATATYIGLPICDCIHAPRWMQISYLALGPVYFWICELVGLENPYPID